MILVTGSNGFLGKAMCEKLVNEHLSFYPTTHIECDLRNLDQTALLFKKVKPDVVINLSAFLGGVHFGVQHAAEMFSNNMLIQISLLESCRNFGVRRLINPIGSCVYPGNLSLYKEGELWNGPMHDSVLPFATAKKAFIVACEAYHRQYNMDFINLVMSNMYGPNDHFDESRSHAVGALIKKMVTAKEIAAPTVTVLGSGNPIREWLYVEDAVDALFRAINIAPYDSIINIGAGQGISIQETANMIKKIVGYKGELINDTKQLDGAMCKQVDGTLGGKLLGWSPKTSFEDGLNATINWFLDNKDTYL